MSSDTTTAGLASPAFDEWLAVCTDRTLYENPLGADGDIHEYWSKPASELGLPRLTRIYNEGLRVTRNEIEEFSQELAKLESYWASSGLIEGELSRPKERMEFVREAVEVARRDDGVVNIS